MSCRRSDGGLSAVLSRDAAIPRLRRALVAPCTTTVRGLASEVVAELDDDPVRRPQPIPTAGTAITSWSAPSTSTGDEQAKATGHAGRIRTTTAHRAAVDTTRVRLSR